MRDRREALKLLAGGTAAALGTSIITTSHAFADGGTIPCRPTGTTSQLSLGSSQTRIEQGNKTQAIELTLAAGALSIGTKSCNQCGAGTPTSSSATREYLWRLDSAPNGFALSLTQAGAPITSFATASSVPQRVFIRRTASGDFQTGNNALDDFRFDLRLTIRWRCQYGTAFAWNCEAYTASVRWQNNGNSADSSGFLQNFGPATINAACDSGGLPEVP